MLKIFLGLFFISLCVSEGILFADAPLLPPPLPAPSMRPAISTTPPAAPHKTPILPAILPPSTQPNSAPISAPKVADSAKEKPADTVSGKKNDPDQAPSTTSTANKKLTEVDTGIRGDWLEKLKWATNAKNYQEQIIQAVLKIKEARNNNYESKINQVRNMLDTFYTSMRVDRSSVNKLVEAAAQDLDNRLEKLLAKTKAAELSHDLVLISQVDAIDEQVRRFRGEIDQIKLDLESIYGLDRSFTKRIKVLDDYILEAYECMNDAEDTRVLMLDIIDDEIARKKSYEIKYKLERVQQIAQYVQTDALQYFDSEVQTFTTEVGKLKKKIDDIKQRVNQLGSSFDKQLATIKSRIQQDQQEETPESNTAINDAGSLGNKK